MLCGVSESEVLFMNESLSKAETIVGTMALKLALSERESKLDDAERNELIAHLNNMSRLLTLDIHRRFGTGDAGDVEPIQDGGIARTLAGSPEEALSFTEDPRLIARLRRALGMIPFITSEMSSEWLKEIEKLPIAETVVSDQDWSVFEESVSLALAFVFSLLSKAGILSQEDSMPTAGFIPTPEQAPVASETSGE